MNIAQDGVITAPLECPAEKSGVLQTIQRNVAVSFKSKVDETKVLRDDRRRGTGEVEREGVLDRAKVMELEDEILGEMGFVAPDNPTNTDVGQTEFVAAKDVYS